jgi:2-oxoglutarate ferredoxin oxidoreductase subunit gamma
METSIIIAGFGGQGVLFAGKLLAHAGMDNGFHVTWIPSYGPEMRGGTANCTVIISDDPIGAPLVSQPDIVLALNQPSFEKYEPLVAKDGLLVFNSSLVTDESLRTDIDVAPVAMSDMAEQLTGVRTVLNMAGIGAMVANRPILSLTAIEQALADHIPNHKADLLAANLTVLRQAYDEERRLLPIEPVS